LQDLANGGTPKVTISEQTQNQLRIDLGTNTFDGSSTAQATGLSYENAGSPATSHSATVDISGLNNIATLRALLPLSTVTLGPIADAAGGLSNVAISAGFIVVTGLDTSQANPGNVELTAVGTLTVGQNAILNTGTGKLALAAGVNSDGTGSGAGGQVSVQDSGFESPNVGNGIWTPDPPGPPWTYQGTAGVSGNGSGFTVRNPDAPAGDQVAYLQEQGNVSQQFSFVSGSYQLSVLAAQRYGDGGIQTVQLELDHQAVGAPIQPTGTSYLSYTVNFWVTAGNHTITLAGLSSSDNTAFIDSVSITNTSGILTLANGSTTVSADPYANAITLRGEDLAIDTSSNPALVGAIPIAGGPALATITGLGEADALAFDAEGNLYVADYAASAVYEYAPGATTPKSKLTGLNSPDALAFDTEGDLYVADAGASAVYVFAPGATRPTSALTLTIGVDEPSALAFDSSGNLFVANNDSDGVNNTVSMFAPGITSPKATLTGVEGPAALAFDASGRLYVADTITSAGAPPVAEFDPGATFPTNDLSGGPAQAYALAVDSSGNVYVSDTVDGTVSVYPPGASSPNATITSLQYPKALAIDKRGNLFVSDAGSDTVSVFAPDNTTATATIDGLQDPYALAFDPSGKLYVLSYNSVSEFGPTPEAGGVNIRGAEPDLPIHVGFDSDPGPGLSVTGVALAQVFTTADGTVTFGDPTQTGNITFAGASPATIAGASVAAVQSPAGDGAIILDGSAGTALTVGTGNVQLSAGTGGIIASPGASSLATTGQVSLDTTGGIGTRASRILFDAVDTPAAATIGDTSAPAAGAYLGGLGNLTLGSVNTANSPLDVTAALDLTVAPNTVLETGTGTLLLAAGISTDGTSPSGSDGVLTIAAGADVVSADTAEDAITLRGADINIATGANPAIVGGRRPSPTTLTGLDGPDALAFSPGGDLYVANEGYSDLGATVSVIAPGSNTPKSTLTGVSRPTALAFDASGNLYVANHNYPFNVDSVTVFPPGYSTPKSTLTGVIGPSALAIDALGNLYVSNAGLTSDGTTVSVFPQGSTTPKWTITGLNDPHALAFDAGGNLYVANVAADTVSVFGPESTTLIRTLTGLSAPTALAFDAGGNLYVANPGADTVSVFAPGRTTPNSTLTDVSGPTALAIDAEGNLYVANGATTGLGTTVSVFPTGSTTPTSTLTGLSGPAALAFDSNGKLYVANGEYTTISEFSATQPIASAGGVVFRTALPGQPINVGGASGTGLSLSDAELAQLFTTAGRAVTIGDSNQTGDITVTGSVSRHPGFDTLILQTPGGAINAAGGAMLSVANLALQAGTGIGTTGAMAIDATYLGFASQSGAIQLSNSGAVTLTSIGPISASSIPGDVFSAAEVGDSFRLLHSGGGVTGQITYSGRALTQDATLTLADGNHYRIDYKANGGEDVTLTRVASLTLPPPVHSSPGPGPGSTPPPVGVALEGSTLVITGSASDDVVRLVPHGKMLRVYTNFLPPGAPFLAFQRKAVKQVLMQLGDGDDRATVAQSLRLPVAIVGGAGDDRLTAGGGSSLLIGGPGRDVLSAPRTERRGSILIGGSTSFDANDIALSAILAEWSSSRPPSTRIANIERGSGSRWRLNGDALLTAITLVDDGARDVLSGNPKRDWFLPCTGDAVVKRKLCTDRGAPSDRRA
jgi:DNA-binding beta-propeller fold protein YncE